MSGGQTERGTGTKLDDVGAEVVESAFAEEEAAPEAGLSLFGVRVEEPDGAVGGLLALVRLGVECFLLELGLLADFVAYFVEEVGGGVFPLRRLCRFRPGRGRGASQPRGGIYPGAVVVSGSAGKSKKPSSMLLEGSEWRKTRSPEQVPGGGGAPERKGAG